MPKGRRSTSTNRRRHEFNEFDHLVSPLGRDPEQHPDYSPAKALEDREPKAARASRTERATYDRRDG